MRSLLDHQADGIEYTLHSHGIEASVEGGNISPRLIQFHIRLGPGVKFSRVTSLGEELALALGVAHCRITRDGYTVKLEIPRPDPIAVQLFPLMRTMPGDLPELAPILGLDENGVPLLLKLSSPEISHILITGTTGSGKTTLARSMISSLALQNQPDQLRLMLIDPKRRGFGHFNGLPNLVCPVIYDSLDALHRLRWAVRHMEKRDETGINTPMLVIFIDELAELVLAMGREFEQVVARLTQRGREAGIHVVGCTQKATSQAIGTIARSNFPTRIVGKVMSQEDARAATGVNGSGAEKLMGQGDFLLFARDNVTRLQAAHLSQEEMVQTVIHLGGQPSAQNLNREMQHYQSFENEYAKEIQPETYTRSLRRSEPAEDSYDQPRERIYQPSQYIGNNETLGVAERLARYQSAIKESRQTEKQQSQNFGYGSEQEQLAQQRPAKERKPAQRKDDLYANLRNSPEAEENSDLDLKVSNYKEQPVQFYASNQFNTEIEEQVEQPRASTPPKAKSSEQIAIKVRANPIAQEETPIERVDPRTIQKSKPSRPVISDYNEPEDLWGTDTRKIVRQPEPTTPRNNSSNGRGGQATPIKPVAKVQTQVEQPKPVVQPSARPLISPKPQPSLSRSFNPIPKPRSTTKDKMETDADFEDYEESSTGFADLTRDGGKTLIDTLKTRATVLPDPDDLPKF